MGTMNYIYIYTWKFRLIVWVVYLYTVYIYVGYKPLTMDADASNDVEGWLMC